MTYKKPSIQVSGTTLMGIDFSGDANAYEALKAHKTIKAKVNDEDALIPFHAVKEFAKSVVAEDAERTDPYCGGGTEPINRLAFEPMDVGGFTSVANTDCETFEELLEKTKNGEAHPTLSAQLEINIGETHLEANYDNEPLTYAESGEFGGILLTADYREDERGMAIVSASEEGLGCFVILMSSHNVNFTDGTCEVTW